jgi:hypothetical protein
MTRTVPTMAFLVPDLSFDKVTSDLFVSSVSCLARFTSAPPLEVSFLFSAIFYIIQRKMSEAKECNLGFITVVEK